MKALTLHQPWASLIQAGIKRYETRPRSLKHRGELAIHAGKKYINQEEIDEVRSRMPFAQRPYVPVHYPLGMVLLVADMTDCIEMTEEFIEQVRSENPVEIEVGNWEPGRFAYKLENVRPLSKPLEIGGKQGLWNLDDDLIAGLY